ncbi:MAG: polysaccharide biosynthesis tyrosine autokinase [Gallionella sp.]|nr:polysaccharide biosynthesis tyrosine autokinase [Gallionella sp.]MDD4946752.1 polysaccharide biosynthesis tyrosine autokinase [Gallionella sp.]
MQHIENIITEKSSQTEDGAMDLLAYWRVIQRRKWGILGLSFFITLLVVVIVYMMTPIYSSSVSMLIEQNKSKLASMDDIYSGQSSDKNYYQTQVEMLQSRALREAVVDRLKLTKSSLFNAPVKPSLVGSLKTALGMGAAKDVVRDERRVREGVVAALSGMIKIEPSKNSQLVRIVVESVDKDLAATVANAVAETYIDLDLEARYKMTQKATSWMNVRLVALKDNLDKSERELQTYREQHNIIDTKGLELGGATSQLGSALSNLAEVRLARAQAQTNLEQVRRAKGNEVSLPIVQRNPLVAGLISAVADHERKVSELSNRYGPQHPKLIQAQAELKQAKANLHAQVADVVSGFEREYEMARANEGAIAGAVAEAKNAIQGSNRKEYELTALEREVKTNRELYDMFMGQLKGTAAVGDMQTVVARVVDPAIVSDAPIKPRKLLIAGFTLLVSLMLGVAVAFLLEYLDNSVRSAQDAERKLGLPLLAAVPDIELPSGKSAGLYYRDAPQSLFAEAIKTIRTGILLSGIDHPKKTLLVTSSVPGEGKSTVAIDLALAHAQTKRVLLIDADMRRPSIAKVLGLDNTHPGLSMLVLGMVKLENCVYKIEGSTLDVLTAGSIPPNPLELILSEKFKGLLAELSKQYDIIMIDSPPVQLVSDAVVLASMATGVVFVLKADSTPFQLARRAIYSLQRSGANMFGVVLNKANFRNEEYYGGYGKYNYHAYYGEDADKKSGKVG